MSDKMLSDGPRFNPEAVDGVQIPDDCAIYDVRLLRWFCPDLTDEEAAHVARVGAGTERAYAPLRALIEREWPGILARRSGR